MNVSIKIQLPNRKAMKNADTVVTAIGDALREIPGMKEVEVSAYQDEDHYIEIGFVPPPGTSVHTS